MFFSFYLIFTLLSLDSHDSHHISYSVGKNKKFFQTSQESGMTFLHYSFLHHVKVKILNVIKRSLKDTTSLFGITSRCVGFSVGTRHALPPTAPDMEIL
ncbi:hypothetical protein EZS27_030374 [termite gut metagenome]|uniref:Uncharacterized protein n=1 Tax=termite gut metagenome TaxID=433724 RepID=A0A5J4QEZ2_9ZZZZ